MLVVDDDDLPLARGRVEHHLVDELATGVGELSQINIELDVLLLIVTHELELSGEALGALGLLRKGHLVRLLGLLLRGERSLGSEASHVDLLEQMERLTSLVDTAELDLGALLNVGNLEALLHLPDGDLVLKLLHEKLHDVVALRVDHKSGQVVSRRLLEVADDQVASVASGSDRHTVSRRNAEAASHDKAEICRGAVLLSIIENLRVKALIEVDNGVLEVSIASWALAHAASAVIVYPLGLTNTAIAHVLTSTFLADLEIRVSMKLGKVGCGDSRLAMKTIDILAYDVFQVVSVHQLDHSHVSQGWVGLLDGLAKGVLVSGTLGGCSLGCLRLLHLLELLLVRGCLPASGTSLEDGIESGSIVRNSTGGRDTSSSESDHMLCGEDHLCKH